MNNIDELENKLESAEGEIKVDLLLQIAVLVAKPFSGKALAYTKEAMELAEKIEYHRGKANALTRYAKLNLQNNKIFEAIKYFHAGKILLHETGDKKAEAAITNSLAVAYAQVTDFEKALKYFIEVLKYSTETEDDEFITKAHCGIGNIYLTSLLYKTNYFP